MSLWPGKSVFFHHCLATLRSLFCSFPLTPPSNTIPEIQYIPNKWYLFSAAALGRTFKSHGLHRSKKVKQFLAAQAWQPEECYEYCPEWLCFTSCYSLGTSARETLPKCYVAWRRMVIMDKVPQEKKKKKDAPTFLWLFFLFVLFCFQNLWNVLVGQHRQKSAKGFQLWLQNCYQTQKSANGSWRKTWERTTRNNLFIKWIWMSEKSQSLFGHRKYVLRQQHLEATSCSSFFFFPLFAHLKSKI